MNAPLWAASEGTARRTARRGFTLIELLVVVAIIALLMAILVPNLNRARAQARLSVCLSNLRQLGTAIHVYADQYAGAIPRGPDGAMPFAAQHWDEWATNQVWIGFLGQYQGIGGLLRRDLTQPRVLFCPDDDSSDPVEELRKIERAPFQDAYSSYFYRQRDQTTRDRLENLGRNDRGFAARALALDANSLGSGDFERTNHAGRRVNILYLEGHVLTRDNAGRYFALRGQDYFGFPESIEQRLNEIVMAADFAERDDPAKLPPLP